MKASCRGEIETKQELSEERTQEQKCHRGLRYSMIKRSI
jgi:hypothetical protein